MVRLRTTRAGKVVLTRAMPPEADRLGLLSDLITLVDIHRTGDSRFAADLSRNGNQPAMDPRQSPR
ncbi:hypothetical protein FHT71_001146 [Rhizobium sp. BK060]|nr:hypothetical protein [Rhizobium sp. BK060]